MDTSTQIQQQNIPPPPNGLLPPNSKTPDGRERLHQIVSVAIEVAAKHNHPDQVRAIQQLYEQSKTDKFIAELMDVVLARKATPEQFAHFQTYMKSLREEILAHHTLETSTGQGNPQDQRPLEFTGEGKSFTAINSEVVGYVTDSTKPGPEGLQDQVMGESADSSLSTIPSARQHITESDSGSKVVVPPPKVNTKAISKGKRKRLMPLKQDTKIKNPPANFRRNKHPNFEPLSDTEYHSQHHPRTRGSRSSKRLKTVHEEQNIGTVKPPSSGDKENVVEEGSDSTMSLVSTTQSLFSEIIDDRDFVFKVIDGCMIRSAKAGYAEIGHAIKGFYEESLVDSSLEGFFESLVTGRIGSGPILHFQKYVQEYIRDARKADSKGNKPAAKDTGYITGGNELGYTIDQYGGREGLVLQPGTTLHSNSTVRFGSARSSVGNEVTTNVEVSTTAHENRPPPPATTPDVGSIPAPPANIPHPTTLPAGMTGVSGMPGASGSSPQPKKPQSLGTTSSPSTVPDIHSLLVESGEQSQSAGNSGGPLPI